MSQNKIAIIFVLLTSSILVTDSMKLIDTIQMEANEISPMIKFVFKCVRTAEAMISLLNKQKSATKSDSRSIKNFSFDPLNPSVRGLNKTNSNNETETTVLSKTTTELSQPDTSVEPEVDSVSPDYEIFEDEPDTSVEPEVEENSKAPDYENVEDETKAPEDKNVEENSKAPDNGNVEDETKAPEDKNVEDKTKALEDENVEDETKAPEDKNVEDETETEIPTTTLSSE